MITTMYGLQWRELERGDEYILKESSYRCLFPPGNTNSLCPEDTWMDIGANFGSFAVRTAGYVKRVIAVEPAPVNLEHLDENLRLNDIQNVDVVRAAIVGGDSQPVNLGLGKTFNYTHRVGHIRGRENITVKGFNIDEVVNFHMVNKIKMDCEGSEREILANIDYAPIEEIIFEWHFTLIPDPDWTKLQAALWRLEENGFEILKQPKNMHLPTKRWTAIIWARKTK